MTPEAAPRQHICANCDHSEGAHFLTHDRCHGTYKAGKCDCTRYAEAEAAAGTALDVERLARALWREAHVCQDWGEHAAKIAAEYARLAAASEPAAGEPK